MIEKAHTVLGIKKTDLERVKNEIEDQEGIHCLKMVFRASCELEKNLLIRIKHDSLDVIVSYDLCNHLFRT